MISNLAGSSSGFVLENEASKNERPGLGRSSSGIVFHNDTYKEQNLKWSARDTTDKAGTEVEMKKGPHAITLGGDALGLSGLMPSSQAALRAAAAETVQAPPPDARDSTFMRDSGDEI